MGNQRGKGIHFQHVVIHETVEVLDGGTLIGTAQHFQIFRLNENADSGGSRCADGTNALFGCIIRKAVQRGSILVAVDLGETDCVEDGVADLDQGTIAKFHIFSVSGIHAAPSGFSGRGGFLFGRGFCFLRLGGNRNLGRLGRRFGGRGNFLHYRQIAGNGEIGMTVKGGNVAGQFDPAFPSGESIGKPGGNITEIAA